MRLLDLYCSAFGAGFGYAQAGFEVVGVDRVARRSIPDGVSFVKADVLDVLDDVEYLRTFDVIHASPPCQTHSRTKHLRDAQGKGTDKVDLIDETREGLRRAGVTYIIENVPGAPVREDLLLCGSMFTELRVTDETGVRFLQRHRLFEIEGVPAPPPPRPCDHAVGVRPLGVYGSRNDDIPSGGQTCRTVEQAQRLMGMPWAGWTSLVEAIPPAYTRWIGQRIMGEIGGKV